MAKKDKTDKVEVPAGLEYHQVDRNVMGSNEISRRFGVANATEFDIEFIEFAQYLDEELPNSREKSLALTALEEAQLWAMKAMQADVG